ncbi:hypothetical protein AbraIFM66950_011779 [Aspergillus brasiliensis]|nr:hypothetical protein AbraIFM66950_011779 [Aspergillus brasiliensis]
MDYLGMQGGPKDWNTIAAKLAGRSNKDCRKRWHKIGPNIRKGAWTPSEDGRLQDAVKAFGERHAVLLIITEFSLTRVKLQMDPSFTKECAKRWRYALNPDVSLTPWTEEQDSELLRAVNELGRNWSKIGSTKFPYRSTVDIKNRYCILQRRRLNTTTNPTHNTRADSPIDVNFSEELGWSEPEDTLAEAGNDPHDTIESSPLHAISDTAMTDYDLNSAALSAVTPIDLGNYPDFSHDMLPSFATDMSIEPLDPEYLQFLDGFEQPKAPAPVTGLECITAKEIITTGTGSKIGDERGGEAVDAADRNQSSQTDARQSPTGDRPQLSTLILEEMEPQTVNLVVNTLLSSNSRFRMRLDNHC